jgi:hypothetical protein
VREFQVAEADNFLGVGGGSESCGHEEGCEFELGHAGLLDKGCFDQLLAASMPENWNAASA